MGRYAMNSKDRAMTLQHGGQSVLKARLTGNFPGSPITVNFSFVLAGGKIRSLEIRS